MQATFIGVDAKFGGSLDWVAISSGASPTGLVCVSYRSGCTDDLCASVDCSAHGTCASPLGTCTCDTAKFTGYNGDRCETRACCSTGGNWCCTRTNDGNCNSGCCGGSSDSGNFPCCEKYYAGWDAACDRSC